MSKEVLISSSCVEDNNGDHVCLSFNEPKSLSEITASYNLNKILAAYLLCNVRWNKTEIDGFYLNKISEEVTLDSPLIFKGTPNPGLVEEEKVAIPDIIDFLNTLYKDINVACGVRKECKS